MKKQIFLGSLLALTSIINAQTWTSVTGQLTTTGKVGIGTATPLKKLDVLTNTAYDGIRITQADTISGAHCTLRLDNAGGHNYGFASSGVGSSEGRGHFMLYDYTSNKYSFFVDKVFGHMGFGTTTPDLSNDYARIFANEDVVPLGQGIFYHGVKGHVQTTSAIPGAGAYHTMIGLEGVSTGYNGEAYTYGVYGEGKNAHTNWGGYFKSAGGSYLGKNYGIQVDATSSSPSVNYGIYATAGNAITANYAGYFAGNVIRTGTDNFTSDRKLKNDIKSINNALDKIKLLNPCTYTFKKDDNLKNLYLPSGKQIGLIAQELEQVFPELVSDNPANIKINENGEKIEITPSFKSVQYVSLIPVLIAGMQEQQKQIEEQKALINELLKSKSAMPTGINDIEGASGFKMEQNIPNPFSSETVIKYTLSEQTKSSSLVVYDLSGKQVASFPIEKNFSSITITSEKLAAGIYIYSIFADGKIIDSKRMVVTQK